MHRWEIVAYNKLHIEEKCIIANEEECKLYPCMHHQHDVLLLKKNIQVEMTMYHIALDGALQQEFVRYS